MSSYYECLSCGGILTGKDLMSDGTGVCGKCKEEVD